MMRETLFPALLLAGVIFAATLGTMRVIGDLPVADMSGHVFAREDAARAINDWELEYGE